MSYGRKRALWVACMLLASGFSAACSSDSGDSAKTVDPAGNWSITATWGKGDCNLSGTQDTVFTLTKQGSNYAISESDPSVMVSGTVTCDDKSCALSAEENGPTDGGSLSIAYNLKLDAGNHITGTGTVSGTFDDGSACSQAFTASGTHG